MNQEKWPLWIENTENSALDIFEITKDAQKISFCPEGEALNFNYNTGQHQYDFCQ